MIEQEIVSKSSTSTSTNTGIIALDKAADSLSPEERIKLECETYLNSQLEQYQKPEWSDFSTAGRSHFANLMAQEIVFKQVLGNFKKDNPLSTHEPKFKTKPDWFGYGVEVEMKLIEECPTNLGKPFILIHRHECYFDGDGKLKYSKKFIETEL